MTITGYSDRINHALAFAAKHHDQQVRKGTRLPYLTQPGQRRDDPHALRPGRQRSSREFCTMSSRTACATATRATRSSSASATSSGSEVLDIVARGDGAPGRRRRHRAVERGTEGRLPRATRRCQRVARVGSARRTSCTTRTPSCPISRRTHRSGQRLGRDSPAGRRAHDPLVSSRLRASAGAGFDAPIMRRARDVAGELALEERSDTTASYGRAQRARSSRRRQRDLPRRGDSARDVVLEDLEELLHDASRP